MTSTEKRAEHEGRDRREKRPAALSDRRKRLLGGVIGAALALAGLAADRLLESGNGDKNGEQTKTTR